MIDARALVARALGLRADEIPENAGMDNLERWDSIGHLRIVLLLEELLERSLDTEEMLSIENLYSLNIILGEATSQESKGNEPG